MNFIIVIIVNLWILLYIIQKWYIRTSYYARHFWNYKIQNISKILYCYFIEITTFIEIILQCIIIIIKIKVFPLSHSPKFDYYDRQFCHYLAIVLE